MTSLLAASQLRRRRRQQQAGASEMQVTAVQGATVIRLDLHQRGDKINAMDRIAVAA